MHFDPLSAWRMDLPSAITVMFVVDSRISDSFEVQSLTIIAKNPFPVIVACQTFG